jgi:hypothetical protein
MQSEVELVTMPTKTTREDHLIAALQEIGQSDPAELSRIVLALMPEGGTYKDLSDRLRQRACNQGAEEPNDSTPHIENSEENKITVEAADTIDILEFCTQAAKCENTRIRKALQRAARAFEQTASHICNILGPEDGGVAQSLDSEATNARAALTSQPTATEEPDPRCFGGGKTERSQCLQ